MKIDSNLRAAVKAVCDQKKQQFRSFRWWEERAKAARALMKKPELAPLFISAAKEMEAARKVIETVLRSVCKRTGLQQCGETWEICNEEVFRRAGGVFPVRPPAPPDYAGQLARLAAAVDEKEAAAILRELGIRWEDLKK